MERAAIVILNYNGKKMLQRFLPTVIKFSSFQIFVADNGSSDDSIDFLNQEYPEIQVLLLNKNYGFAEGYNKALQIIRGKYKFYILLNSDVEVTAEWDTHLIQWLENHSEVVALQPKILSLQNPAYFDYAGAGGGFLDRLGYPFCRGRIFETIEKDHGQYDDIIPVHWASGACMAVNSELYHQAGGFDGRFFAHMEEIDLCWKWRNQGRKIYYHGGVSIKHLGGGTLSKNKPKKTFLNFRNSLLTLHNNLPGKDFVLVYGLRLILDLMAVLVFILKGKSNHALAIVKAHVGFYKLKSKKNKRELAPKLSNEPQEKQIKEVNSILWEYYIKGHKYYSEI